MNGFIQMIIIIKDGENMKAKILIRRISLFCLFTSLLVGLVGTLLHIGILAFICVPLLAVYLLLSILFWRCPHCKERLPMRLNMKDEEYINDVDGYYRCPHCNKELN